MPYSFLCTANQSMDVQ